MIKSFADRETERLFNGDFSRRLPEDIHRRARLKLEIIDAAKDLRDLQSAPGNKLHALRDDRSGQHAIRINDQWRICFRWHDGDAHEVEITDYH